MKNLKKMFALLLAMVMVLGMSTITALAAPDTVPAEGTGTITINNAGIGETYNVYKVLDAKVGANGAIVYPGPVPTGLEECFEVSSDGVNLQKKTGLSDGDLFAKLKTWASTATPVATPITATSATVKFTGLNFGYYVVVSTMDNGAVISVTSTDPDAVTYEKNTTVPQPTKTVNGESFSIGDTITYTVKFPGANYMQADATGQNAKIVTKYEVKDTLPEFLSNATVTKVTVAGTDITSTLNVSSFASDKKFDIPWADGNADDGYTSKYTNGAEVVITYTAVLTSIVNVNADNINTVTVTPYVEGGSNPWKDSWESSKEVTTYAAALLKVDGSTPAKPLAGAKFKFKGLEVTQTSDGVYTVVKYDPTSITLGTEMTVDENGKLYIVGLKQGVELVGNETEAPAGYNLLTEEITLSPQVMDHEIYKASGTRKYDAKGNLIESTATESTTKSVTRNLEDLDGEALTVVNNAGTQLPSTGGMGTTLFYVVGGILVLAAGIMLVARKRMSSR